MMKLIKILLILILIFSGFQTIAQTLKFSDIGKEKPKGKISQYIASDGTIFNIGDTLIIGKGTGINGSYVHLYESHYRANANRINMKIIPQTFDVIGSKSSGWKIKIYTKANWSEGPFHFFIEDIIGSGEIRLPGLSNDEALAELKRFKEKVDLELITQEEYDQKKAELMKYIR